MDGSHRPLRGNPPLPEDAASRDAAAVTATPESAGFSVAPRQSELTWYPCQKCHKAMPVNLEQRLLKTPHYKAINHGGDQFWCHDCHQPEAKEQLQTLDGDTVDFNSSYQVCAQCHYQPRRDWFYGAHGKRVANWQGERQIYSCTHCHDAHDPAVRPRAAQPPPPVRRGLEHMQHSAGDNRHDATTAVPAGTADEATTP